MANSIYEATGDGSTTDFTIPYTYLEADDVTALVGGVSTSFTFTSSNVVTFASAPANGVTVRIVRNTDLDNLNVTYSDGGALTAQQLNNSNNQLLFGVQEAIDRANESIAVAADGKYDAQTRGIKNVATPTNANDATNKSYVDTSANNAASSAAAALVSQNAAASSAAAALASQNAAASSQSSTAADVTTTNADVVATNADVVSTNADAASTASDRTAAASSASSASTSAATATTKASDSSTSAAASLASQNAAATSAAAALASQNAAATSQTASATSESNASTSETNSATSATQSANSATASANSASAASTSESNAATSASTASTQATNSATSATNSANSATASANSATASANSASAASTSETNAASSASSASSAQTAAESARDATLAAYDNFDDRYLGAKSSAPTLDNDGNALVAGSLYFDTVAGAMYVYTGSSWVAAYVSGTGFLALTGGTMTGDLNFGDNDKAIFGAGNDLQIYHSNNNSFIEDVGTGNFLITTNGNNIQLMKNQAEQMLVAKTDGSVELYYDNAKKFETTSSGVDVTGGLNTTGNVGIGTSAPTEDLHIKGQDGAHADVIIQAYTGYNSGLNFNDNAGMAGRVYYNHSSNFMAFDTNGSEAARIDSSGDVLIGKTSEALATTGSQFRSSGQALDITRDGGSPLNINRLSSSGELVGFFQDTAQFGQITCFTTNSTDYLQIGSSGSNNAGVVFETNRIYPTVAGSASNGTVDLGTSSVRFKDGYFSGTLNCVQIRGVSDTNTGIDVTGSDIIGFKTGGSERGRFNSAGALLIGKTSDSISNDGISLAGSATGGGHLSATNSGNPAFAVNRKSSDGSCVSFNRDGSIVGSVSVTSSGTTYNTTSDIRLKTDIEPIDHATDMLMAMNPVSHRWKADPDADAVVGFIAQEMQEIVPEAVSTGDDDDAMMSMDYGRITPILVSALQDAHRKIEQLEQRLADMEAK